APSLWCRLASPPLAPEAPVVPRREPFLWNPNGLRDLTTAGRNHVHLPPPRPCAHSRRVPLLPSGGAQGFCLFRECRRIVHFGRRAQPNAQLLLEQQGPALRISCAGARGLEGDGGILSSLCAGAERRRRLDPF